MRWSREFRNGFLLGSLFASAATGVSVVVINTGSLGFSVDYIASFVLAGCCFWLLYLLEDIERGDAD